MLRKALHPLLAALAWAFVALSIFEPVSLAALVIHIVLKTFFTGTG